MSSHLIVGQSGESLARDYVQGLGYRILDVNFRIKMGEIDLVALDGNTVCFIEVKTRTSCIHGQPFEAVHPAKIRKLSKLALFYLKVRYRSLNVRSRFDVISILREKDAPARIQHLNCYALLDETQHTLTYVRVPYDVASAARKIREAGLPGSLATRLERGY